MGNPRGGWTSTCMAGHARVLETDLYNMWLGVVRFGTYNMHCLLCFRLTEGSID